jgi:hypothetical protein
MKLITAILFIVIAPAYAAAQQDDNIGKPCPLSHWSTTGASCDYAPDLSPAIEADLKLGIPRSKEGTYYGRPLPVHTEPLSPIEMPLENPAAQKLPVLKPLFPSIVPLDSLKLKPQQETPDNVIFH